MHIIEDTAQKEGKHELKHNSFNEMGVELRRCKLPYGDYIFPPPISVDTKENMSELIMDITSEHERFRRECERAQEDGCHLYILTETEWDIRSIDDVHIWENPRSPLSQKATTGARAEKILKTMAHKYGVKFMFCHPTRAAEYVLRILNGEFENE